MIIFDKFKEWLSAYQSAYDTGRKDKVAIAVQAAPQFRDAWQKWSQNPDAREGLYACIDVVKSAVDVFGSLYNYPYVFGGRRGEYNYGMLDLLARDLDGEEQGSGIQVVYAMFTALFAEGDIADRYKEFDRLAEERVEKIKQEGLLKETDGHLQRIQPASVYCWLYNPLNHFYFFTNEIVKLCSKQLSGAPVAGVKSTFLHNAYSFMEELKAAFKQVQFPAASEQELSAVVCDFVDYVGTEIRDKAKQPKVKQKWLLVANPSHWSFSSLSVGEEEPYYLHNAEDNKRRIFASFMSAAIGDSVVCYESGSQRAVVAMAEVSAAQDGTCIRIRKTRNLETPLSLTDIKDHPVLGNRFNDIQGSMFPLSDVEYETLVRMMDSPRDAVVWPTKGNLIRFGAPGTGKSYLLNKEAESYFNPQYIERVTFHPEYTSFDFIGAFKPAVLYKGTPEERVTYRFVPGPFARVLKSAVENPQIPHLLLIEEINRANAATVFAEAFQLLDRKENRESRYSISVSEELADYLELQKGQKLTLPSNMYIWATMNSADQGVFPMDTAFKRRWHFEYCGIDEARQALLNIGGYAAAWNTLREHVNKLLQNAGINEDKQMGPFFLSGDELSEQSEFLAAICNKVLMYLYEDAAKHKRGAVFKYSKLRYSQLCTEFTNAYNESDLDAAIEGVFVPIS